MTRSKKLVVFGFAAAAIALISTSYSTESFAQGAPGAPGAGGGGVSNLPTTGAGAGAGGGGDSGGYGYKFEDDPLSAGGFGPNDATIRVRPGPVRTTLIRPRTSFVPEMLKSVENI